MPTTAEDVYIRQSKYYIPGQHNKPVTIVGCGSLGGNIAVALAKLGLNNFTLWDFDTVEPHNIPNQPFDQAHLTMHKVIAVRDMICEQYPNSSRPTVLTYEERFTDSCTIPAGTIIINTADNITVRRLVADKAPEDSFIIDARSGPDSFNLYFCDKNSNQEWEFYNNSFFDEAEGVGGGCGAQSTVFGNLAITALAVNGYVRFANCEPVPAQINGHLMSLETEQIYL